MMTANMGFNDIFISVTPDKKYRRNQNSLNKKEKGKPSIFGILNMQWDSVVFQTTQHVMMNVFNPTTSRTSTKGNKPQWHDSVGYGKVP